MTNVTPFEAEKLRAFRAVQAAVQGLPATDVVEVLTEQLREITAAMQEGFPDLASTVLRDRTPGRLSSIEKDPEIETFILKQSPLLGYEGLREACIKEFGKARAPSRGSIHRYIQKLKYRTKGDRK